MRFHAFTPQLKRPIPGLDRAVPTQHSGSLLSALEKRKFETMSQDPAARPFHDNSYRHTHAVEGDWIGTARERSNDCPWIKVKIAVVPPDSQGKGEHGCRVKTGDQPELAAPQNEIARSFCRAHLYLFDQYV